MICIYVAIGQKQSTVRAVVAQARRARRDGVHHRRRGHRVRARRRCSIIAPYAGCAMGEYFLDNGEARAASSTTTSPSTPPPTARSRCCCAARRAARPTPATSSTCTRACSSARRSCRDELGGGSLTALPIIETQAGDVSAYIPTNVISITDGQIYLETDLFYSGVRPAINVGISVSRVGGDAQIQGDEEGRRDACASTWRSTASWRRSRSSAPTSTRPRRSSSPAASAWSRR